MTNREYRVWCETGDYKGGAEVISNHGWHTVHVTPFTHGTDVKPKGFRSAEDAYSHAKTLAEEYMAEAIADATERDGEPPVGILSEHGYSIQVCEGDRDITNDPY